MVFVCSTLFGIIYHIMFPVLINSYFDLLAPNLWRAVFVWHSIALKTNPKNSVQLDSFYFMVFRHSLDWCKYELQDWRPWTIKGWNYTAVDSQIYQQICTICTIFQISMFIQRTVPQKWVNSNGNHMLFQLIWLE